MIHTRQICARCASRLRTPQIVGGISTRSQPHLSASYSSAPDVLEEVLTARRTTNPDLTTRHGLGTQPTAQEAMDHAVSLFNDVINASATAPPNTSTADWEVAGKLKVMEETQTSYPAGERLHAFNMEIVPYFDALQGPAPKHIFLAATRYIGRITSEVVSKQQLGLSVEISETLAKLGHWDMSQRNSLVLNLCWILIRSMDPRATHSAPQALIELIDMWKHMSQLGRASQVGKPLAFTFPNTEEIHQYVQDESLQHVREHLHKKDPRKTGLSQLRPVQVLSTLLLAGSPATTSKVIPGLLATLVVLWDRRIVGAKVPPEAEPLLKAAATVLHRTQISTVDMERILSPDQSRLPLGRLKGIRTYVKEQWAPTVKSLLKTEDKSWGDTIVPTESRRGGSYLFHLHKTLRQALRARNLHTLTELWETFKKRMEVEPQLGEQLKNDPDFLDFCIYVWCFLQQDQCLAETVELMQRLDIEPTIKSYTAMMHGWRQVKDIARIDTLWSMLSKSNIQLDTYAWAERVSAYIQAGRPQRAIESLGEMMRLWKAAEAAGQPDKAARPTIEVINATLKELLRLDKKAAQDVLTWASTENILPNIFTYNILLREAFRGGSPDSVPGLLVSMREQGIDPDNASFTIILEELISTMESSSASEQVGAISQIFEDMSAAGIVPTSQTYGKMLYAITGLRDGGADEAVQAILDHARNKGHPITPHMVTILIERILSRESLDINGIEVLLKEHNINRTSDGDPLLWERVMTGYAQAGKLASAMSIFDHFKTLGKPMSSLSPWRDMLQALLDAGEVTNARKVVELVLQDKMAGSTDKRGDERYWKHHFWFLADSRGLLDGMTLPPKLPETLGNT